MEKAIPQNKHHRPQAMMLKVARIISAGLLLAGLLLGAYALNKKAGFNKAASQLFNGGGASPTLSGTGLQPVQLKIPSLNLTAPIAPVGVDAANSLQIPSQDNAVGWYKNGPLPGTEGSAVIDGHLDSAAGPAIFWTLHNIKTNDQVIVTFNDGSQKTFTVYATQSVPQDNFPTQKVYSDPGFAALNLITCIGTYSRTLGRYSSNLVVYTKLAS